MRTGRSTWSLAGLGLAAAGAVAAALALAAVTPPPPPGQAGFDPTSGAVPPLAPLPPLAPEPQAPPKATLLPVIPRSWLPPAEVPQGPRPTSEGLAPVRARPAADLPALAAEPNPLRPARPALAAGPLASAPSADIGRPPARLAASRSDPDRPNVADDPTLDSSRQAALAAAPRFRTRPVPLLRLVIPDPFETMTALELGRAPPDADPPASVPGLPSKPPPPTVP